MICCCWECFVCNCCFIFYEQIEEIVYCVVKLDGFCEEFGWSKMFVGFFKVCEKWFVFLCVFEEIVDEVEVFLQECEDCEIMIKEFGEFVMECFCFFDQVVYVCFVLVYCEFEDIELFMSELCKMFEFCF